MHIFKNSALSNGRDLSFPIKLKTYKAVVRSILLYMVALAGYMMQTWSLRDEVVPPASPYLVGGTKYVWKRVTSLAETQELLMATVPSDIIVVGLTSRDLGVNPRSQRILLDKE